MGGEDPLDAALVGGPSDPISTRAPENTLFKEAHLECPAIPRKIWKPLNGRLFPARAGREQQPVRDPARGSLGTLIASPEAKPHGVIRSTAVPERWKILEDVKCFHFELCP